MKTEIEQIEAIEMVAAGEAALDPAQGSRFSALARDVATMSGGMALAALFNTLLVFLIPRLVSVEDFGYWRLFLLYSGYTGLLHMGLADGALLRWAGRPLEAFRHEVGPSMKFLFWQHLAFIIPAGLIVALLLPLPLGLIGIAVFVLALIMNLATIVQYGLQASRQFKAVAFATAAPAGLFVLLAFLWHLRAVPGYGGLIVLYCTAWVGVLVYLWPRLKPQRGSHSSDSAWSLGKTCILLGWPVVLANGGFGLVQSADRLAVSSAMPITSFAQYSLAASTMFVPVAAITAVYRVFFSHVAAVEHEGRARVYGHASKFLLLAWSLLLPYFFVLEVFVRRFLPKYLAALPIAGVLLLGVIFLAGIQILHMSFAYLYGRQRQFLILTVGAVALSVSVALIMAIRLRLLVAVAIGQVVTLAIWWLVNEWKLREVTGQGWKDWLRVWTVFIFSGLSYGVALSSMANIGLRILIYYAIASCVLLPVCFEELRFGWKLLVQANSLWPPQPR